MDGIVSAVCELLESGETVVLATIISHAGSTPRTSGSRMVVTADGRGVGTIGGGVLEAGVMSRAVELIPTGQSLLMPFDLSVETVSGMDMICGGRAEVLLACIQPTPANRTVFGQWRRLNDDRQTGWLLTAVNASDGVISRIDRCVITASGQVIGDWPAIAGEPTAMLPAVCRVDTVSTLPTRDGFVLVEPAKRVSTAYLFGGGHVALFTGRTAAMVGFRVSVADDREAFANRERFPDAGEIRVLETFDRAFDGISVSDQDCIVILTRGHLHDQTVLARALGTDAGYIGMIGSRKKRDAIYEALLKDGFSRTDIDRVHSPIGLAIGAETPEEIAVSIVAEMIRHRAAQSSKGGR